jgi:putative flavoprotein involved in K+ transport
MTTTTHHLDTVVVGGGQAGLATGHHLARTGRSFVILDAHHRVGDAWRTRWDSLVLFTPARRTGLPGMPFPAPRASFPTHVEMADYLECYVAHFELPVRSGVRVDALGHEEGRFIVSAGDARYVANNVVVATGSFQVPRTPAFAGELDPRVVQLHSARYRNPAQLREGPVLVVGPGNSGADIALDLARGGRETWLAGDHPGNLPIDIDGVSGRLAFPLLWQLWTHVLNVDTRVGRRARAKVLSVTEPLIRVKPRDLDRAGVRRTGRVLGVRDGLPLVESDRALEVTNVIWATGYRSDFGWIDVPVDVDGFGEPVTDRGVATSHPGLYFVGRPFQYAFNSHTVGGVGKDAGRVVAHLKARPVTASGSPAGMVLAA